MLRLIAEPNFMTVAVNETVTYRVESTDWTFLLDENDVFLWGVGEITDFRSIGNGISVGGKVDGPVRGNWEHKYSFAREGRFQVIAVLQRRAADVRPRNDAAFHGMEYFQNVAATESFMWDPVNNERTHARDPTTALAGLTRYYNFVFAAGVKLGLEDFSQPGLALRDRHLGQLKVYAGLIGSLVDRLESTQDWIRIPITATHAPRGGGSAELSVFLAHPKNEGIVKHWKIVDWTHPGDLVLDREYSGRGYTDADAIKDAIRDWGLANQYPEGELTFRIPRNVYAVQGAHGRITTNGRSWTGQVSDFLERAGLFLTVVAIVLAVAPIPGSTAAAVALVAVFAGAVTAAGAALNMYDRHDHGVDNATADGLDMLTIAGSLLGIAGQWARGATITMKLATGARQMILIGEVTLDSVQGILVAVEAVGEIQQTIDDKTLTPDEKFKRMLKTGAALVVRAALIYVNVRGTMKDLARINTPRPPPPQKPPKTSKGDKLEGPPSENLKKMKDPEAKIDLTEDQTVTGNTNKGAHTTTVHADPPRTATAKTTLESHFPKGDKFWIERTFTDTEIVLKHRFHDAPNDRTADLQFRARLHSDGVIHVDIIKTANWRVKATGELITNPSEGARLQAEGLAEPIHSEYFDIGGYHDGSPCLIAKELYPMMFDHFEAAAARTGVQIKGVDGQFAWANYRAWKTAVAAGKDPTAAILENSKTGPLWKKELDARGYEYKMAPGFPREDPAWEQVFWMLIIKKK